MQFGSVQPDTFSGFSYSLVGVISDAARLAFRVELEEPWRGWCALQKPPSTASVTSCLGTVSGFGCNSAPVPGSAGGYVTTCSDDSGKAIAPAQADLCGRYNVCQCQAGCCDGSTGVWALALELHRRSDGTLEGSVDTKAPVYLDPVP